MPQILSGAGVTSPTQLTAYPIPSKPYSGQVQDWMFAIAVGGIVNSGTAVTIAAAVPGLRNYVTALQVATATLGAATELAIRDGAGGTVIWRMLLSTTALPFAGIELPTPLFSSTGNLLEVVTITAVTGGVYVGAQGFVGV